MNESGYDKVGGLMPLDNLRMGERWWLRAWGCSALPGRGALARYS
jgi:hypothetical protein